jgi:hypothetical protein
MTPNPPNNPASPAEASPPKASVLDGLPATLSDEEMLARMPALQKQLAEDEALIARSLPTAFLDAFSNELRAKVQKSNDQVASLEKWLEDRKQERALAEALPQQHAEPAPAEAPVHGYIRRKVGQPQGEVGRCAGEETRPIPRRQHDQGRTALVSTG